MSWSKAFCLISHRIALSKTKLINYKGAIFYNAKIGACAQDRALCSFHFQTPLELASCPVFSALSLLEFEIFLSKQKALLFINTVPRFYADSQQHSRICTIQSSDRAKKVCLCDCRILFIFSPFTFLNKMSVMLKNLCR